MKEPAIKRCAQCWQWRAIELFRGASGKIVRSCEGCRRRYYGWTNKSLKERLAASPRRKDETPKGQVRFMARSGNRKLGGLPSTISERGTCPPTCGFY